jgi:hypothetical protein
MTFSIGVRSVSDEVNIGEYRLEISGDEVLVRDESGAIVDTVELDEVEGELTLPDGQTVDLASVFSAADLDAFQTAAGPANDNTGDVEGSSGVFIPFDGVSGQFGRLESAGVLDETSLGYDALAEIGHAANDFEPQQQARSSFDWSRHETDPTGNEPSHDPAGSHNQSGNNQSPNDDEGEDDEVAPVSNLPSQNSGLSGLNQSGPSTPPTGQQQEPHHQDDRNEAPAPAREDQQPPHDESEDPIDPPADEQQPENVNAAPTDIDLTGTSVVENVSGAIIGMLSAVDPDADSHSFAVSDDRFEVVNGQLKLKDGVALDFETAASVAVTVTATDKAGNQFAEIFTIGVTDVNEAPTAVHLSNLTVDENAAGGAVGSLTTEDPDAGEAFTYQVSDSRFEIVGGQLQLKSGMSLDHETEEAIELKVTSTDSAGHSIERSFTIGVTDVEEEPIVTSDGGGVDIEDYELYTSQLGKGQTTLGAGDDLLHIETKSFSPVRMGDGYDTVHLAQQDRSFDHHDAIKLENVEAIDATGSGANKVSLSIHDVLNMTDSDNRLTIVGDEGDIVTLTGNGNNHWTVVGSNGEFTTYAYSDPSMQAIVEVSNQMNTQVS